MGVLRGKSISSLYFIITTAYTYYYIQSPILRMPPSVRLVPTINIRFFSLCLLPSSTRLVSFELQLATHAWLPNCKVYRSDD